MLTHIDCADIAIVTIAALLSYCGVDGYCLPNQKCWPTVEQVEELTNQIRGRIINSSHPEYITRRHMVNTHFTDAFPSFVALVQSISDVQKCLTFVRNFNIKLTLYSCGHEFAYGRSSANNSFQINFSEMSKVTINLKDRRSTTGQSVTARSGASWEKVYDKVTYYRRQVVGGGCTAVCVAGYTMGGGVSIISRSRGLAVDNVISFDMVLYNGTYVTCYKTHTVVHRREGKLQYSTDTDLFWAVRGAGGGTYGILISLTFIIYDAPQQVVHFQGAYRLNGSRKEVKKMISFIFEFLPQLPMEWSAYILFPVEHLLSDGQSINSIELHMLHNGPWHWNSIKTLQPLINFGLDFQITATYFNFTDVYQFLRETMKFPDSIKEFSVSANIKLNASNDKLIQFFSRDMLTRRTYFIDISCPMTLVGGRVSELTPETAAITVGLRQAHLTASCSQSWYENIPEYILSRDVAYIDCKLHELAESSYINEGYNVIDVTN